MSNFFDADKFRFVDDGEGHLIPVHYRDLGLKDGNLYSKKVSWSDVVINHVPLEQTFEYEDKMSYLKSLQDLNDVKGHIIVNERSNTTVLPEDDSDFQIERRIKNLALRPLSLPEAKKKRTKMNYPVKPKKRAKSEKKEKESEKFQELIEQNDHGLMGKHTYLVQQRAEITDSTFYHWAAPKQMKTFCPPEHWLTPEIRWDLIWSKMDEIEHGKKRSYHYVEPGEYDPDGSEPALKDVGQNYGPAIYFYDKDSDDLNFNYDPHFDYISGYNQGNNYEKVTPLWEMQGWRKNGAEIAPHSRYERAKQEFIRDPCIETFAEYQKRWYDIEQWNPVVKSRSYHGRRERSVLRPQAPMPHL
jgi:hypothetical protein